MIEPFIKPEDLLSQFKGGVPSSVDAGPKLYYASKTDEEVAKQVMTLIHPDLADALNLLISG